MSKHLIRIDEDALEGDPRDIHDCPVTRAFKKAGFSHVFVGVDRAVIRRPSKTRPLKSVRVMLPVWVTDKIKSMIKHGTREPFEFEAEVGDG